MPDPREVADRPVVLQAGVAPRVAVGRLDARARRARRAPFELAVQQVERRRDDRWRSARARRLRRRARTAARAPRRRPGWVPARSARRRAPSSDRSSHPAPADTRSSTSGSARPSWQPGQAELLVGVALQQQPGVPAARCRADAWPRRPPVPPRARARARRAGSCRGVKRSSTERQTPGVGFDNVHPSQRRGAGVQLKGAVAVVTGASSGIGEAVAVASRAARSEGRAGRAPQGPARRPGRSDRTGRRHGPRRSDCDVTDREQLASLPTVVKEAFGPCDILVNNAGRARRRNVRGPHVSADRGHHPGERPRRDVRHPGVPPGDAEARITATS